MHNLLSTPKGFKDLLDRIECSVLFMIKKKQAILVYNLEDSFDEDRYKDLLRYKRVINNRIYDCNYPCSSIDSPTLIEKVNQLAFREGNCSQCITCFPDI